MTVTESFLVGFSPTSHPRLANDKGFATVCLFLTAMGASIMWQNKSKVEKRKRGQEGLVSGLLEKTARKVQSVTLSRGKANDSYVRERSP